MRDEANDAIRPMASVADLALYVSRWTAAKAGAAASLWTVVPRRLNRYLAGMLSAQSQSVRFEDLHASWSTPPDHHFTIGGKLIK